MSAALFSYSERFVLPRNATLVIPLDDVTMYRLRANLPDANGHLGR